MRYVVIVVLATVVMVSTVWALPINLFVDMPTHVQRAEDIVIARCVAPAKAVKYPNSDVENVSEFEVMRVLKGSRTKGKLRVAHWGRVESSRIYLLFNGGGSAEGTTFLAFPELSIVQIPSSFKLSHLDGKTVKEQVTALFKARKDQVERDLRLLQVERAILSKAVGAHKWP